MPVPVNLAYAIGKQIVKALNGYYESANELN
jgi:hypothetical protein